MFFCWIMCISRPGVSPTQSKVTWTFEQFHTINHHLARAQVYQTKPNLPPLQSLPWTLFWGDRRLRKEAGVLSCPC